MTNPFVRTTPNTPGSAQNLPAFPDKPSIPNRSLSNNVATEQTGSLLKKADLNSQTTFNVPNFDLNSNTEEALRARKIAEAMAVKEANARHEERVARSEASTNTYTNLQEINLEHELVTLFNQTRRFLSDCLTLDPEVAPINQIAQAINTCNAVLKEIVKSQGEVYNQEKIKAMEGTLVAVLKHQPKEFQQQFMEDYKLALRQAEMKK